MHVVSPVGDSLKGSRQGSSAHRAETWWKRSSIGSAPMRRRRTSDSGKQPVASPAMMRRSTSENTPVATPSSKPEHLHYRDEEVVPYASPTQEEMEVFKNPKSKEFQRTASTMGDMPDRERQAVVEALKQNERDRHEQMLKEEKERQDLEAALAESTRTAKLESDKDRERVDLARAVLESQRLQILEQRRRAGLPDLPTPVAPATVDSHELMTAGETAPDEPPPSLEASERALAFRNEKGNLWSEGGAHGWLPPGAGYGPSAEESREHQMLGLAIRMSLEEEEARWRRAREGKTDTSDESHHDHERGPAPPELPPRPSASASSSTSAAQTRAIGTSRSVSKPPAIDTNVRPPPPPLPQRPAGLARPPPVPERPGTSRPTSIDFVPPGRPKGWIANNDGGSPEEIPYLLSSTSSHHVGSSDEEEDRRASVPTSPRSTHEGFPLSRRSSTSLDHGSPQAPTDESTQLKASRSSDSILSVRNPDVLATPIIDKPPSSSPDVDKTTQPDPFEVDPAARSMSLISEHTEPPSRENSFAESHDDADARTISTVSAGGTAGLLNREPSLRQTPLRRESTFSDETAEEIPPATAALSALSGAAAVAPVPIAEKEAIQQRRSPSHGSLDLGQQDDDDDSDSDGNDAIFEDSVRFGFLGSCEENHDCVGDGLHSVRMIDTVVLSHFGREDQTAGGNSDLTIEATSWISLLRFLMWYGDTKLTAGKDDKKAAPSRRCDAAMSLEFRRNSLYDCVVRLNISLLAPDHRHRAEELTCFEAPSFSAGKGKAAERLFEAPVCFALPDHLLLPARLSTVAISLYTLRQLSSIATSTQPSVDAAPSFHAMRTLSACIRNLTNEHDQAKVRRSLTPSFEPRHETSPTPPEPATASSETADEPTEVTYAVPTNDVENDRLIGRLRTRIKRMKRASSSRSSGPAWPSSPSSHRRSDGSLGRLSSLTQKHESFPASGSSSNRNRLSKTPSYVQKTRTVKRKDRILGEEEDADSFDESGYGSPLSPGSEEFTDHCDTTTTTK